MTDIDYVTWMLSGSAVMRDGRTIRNGYCCDLDTLGVGSRLGKASESKILYFEYNFSQWLDKMVPIINYVQPITYEKLNYCKNHNFNVTNLFFLFERIQ